MHPAPALVENPQESGSVAPAAPPPPGVMPVDFAAVYEAHSQQIFYLALRLLGDPTQAEDATHDVFMKAWRHLGGFRGEADVRTWLYRITLNHCSNLRSSWHARNVHTQPDDTVFENLAGPTDSPFRDVEMSELGRRIQGALAELPEEYRVLLLLVADQELSYEQIAQLTQQSTDAVRGKLHRARKAFGNVFRKTA
ncbi:MAG: RNA polymerase sigma factor [Verrucomicrobia bacterium]|nr:MAG: RNA polymerase sigma factor [Verrucomicrobiota bacterium]